MRSGFEEKAQEFRRTGQAISLREVPAALDALLDLKSTECRLFLEELGIDHHTLVKQKKLPVGPASAEQIARALSGELTGTGPRLPTTPAEAVWDLARLAPWVFWLARADRLAQKELKWFPARFDELIEVAKGLQSLKRLTGLQRFSFTFQGGLSVRLFRPPKGHKNESQGGILDPSIFPLSFKLRESFRKLIGANASTYLGVLIHATERGSNRRKIEPYHGASMSISNASFGYLLQPEKKSMTCRFGYPWVVAGYSAIQGKYVGIIIPQVGGLSIGERAITVGLTMNRGPLKDGVPVPRLPFIRLPIFFSCSVGGDPVEYVTGPLLRFFELVEKQMRTVRGWLWPRARQTATSHDAQAAELG